MHQTSKKTETTQTNKHLDIVTEQITSLWIVKQVSIAEDWDISLVIVKHHYKIRTTGNKIRMLTKTRDTKTKSAT